MQIYELQTNEGRRYVTAHNDARMRTAMYEYIRTKRAAGVPLREIIFCWSPIRSIPLDLALSELKRLATKKVA
jgi:hypothetical protein